MYTKLAVYFMMILIVLRFLAEIKEAIECKCGSRVVPTNKISGDMEEVISENSTPANLKKDKKDKKSKNNSKSKEKKG